jgi:hypothetical protein
MAISFIFAEAETVLFSANPKVSQLIRSALLCCNKYYQQAFK